MQGRKTYYQLALEPREGVGAEEVWGLVKALWDVDVVTGGWRKTDSLITYVNVTGDDNYQSLEKALGAKALITVLPKAQLLGRSQF
ncbi:MAG: hypothetical protein WCF77_03610 [Minisyncoccia bacterium]